MCSMEPQPAPAQPRPFFDHVANLPAVDEHVVQFYDRDGYLEALVGDFIAASLTAGEQVLVIATPEHTAGFVRHVRQRGVNPDAALGAGQLTLLDARTTLASFLIDGQPDPASFEAAIGALVARLCAPGARPLRAYGEMVDLLCRGGDPGAAVRLEELWCGLGRRHRFSLLCAYGLAGFRQADHTAFRAICAQHTQALPTLAGELQPQHPGEMRRQLEALEERARALEDEVAQRRQLEEALREALTQRRRAEDELRASREELMDFFENAIEGMHKVGADGTILWANRAELELLGYPRDEYVGHHVADFHVDPTAAAELLTRLGRNENVRGFEARLRRKDGSVRHVLINCNARFEAGQFLHSRCFTRDISDRKRLEAELRQQNEDLARAVRFSETFVGILGHDLRNPLSAITTAASLLARRADSERVARPAARILSSGRRMARMIDQLLDFTRIRLGKGIPLERREIDLADSCRLAVEEAAAAGERIIELRADGDLVGAWDGDRLAQLVSNLLGNAIAHGTPETPVTVRLDGSRRHGVELEVHNGGVIPDAIRPVLFEPLKNHSKQERSSGLGLGLYISQQIVLAHGGTIEVVSAQGEGTRVVVSLPRATGAAEPAFESSLREASAP